MKKTRRALSLALALIMALALAACGGSDEPVAVDINALAGDLLAAATFGEDMNEIPAETAPGLYGAPEGTTAVAYGGSGATAEELAVFDCGSAEAAATLVDTLEARNQSRIESYSSYNPNEVPKLESAVILSGGQYVVLIVATDASAAAKIADEALNK